MVIKEEFHHMESHDLVSHHLQNHNQVWHFQRLILIFITVTSLDTTLEIARKGNNMSLGIKIRGTLVILLIKEK